MAKLVDILQQERERDTADKWGIIHLYKTGSFYSAYEWSAWINGAHCFLFIAQVYILYLFGHAFECMVTDDSYLGILSHTASRCIT